MLGVCCFLDKMFPDWGVIQMKSMGERGGQRTEKIFMFKFFLSCHKKSVLFHMSAFSRACWPSVCLL